MAKCFTNDVHINCTNVSNRQIKIFVLENCKIRKKCKTKPNLLQGLVIN